MAGGLRGVSFLADQPGGALLHLGHHDVSFVAVARTPLAEIEAFKRRMGWEFKWVSSFESDFQYDCHVSFTPDELAKGKVFYNLEMRDIESQEMRGTSAFYKDKSGGVFDTYSSYARGGDLLLGAYNYLDLTPRGPQRDRAAPRPDDWVRHHHRYDASGFVDATGRYRAAEKSDACCHAAENHS